MTKLETLLDRIRELPQERQDAIALELEFLLKYPPPRGSALTDAQWAEVEAALADQGEAVIPHDEVMARARQLLAE